MYGCAKVDACGLIGQWGRLRDGRVCLNKFVQLLDLIDPLRLMLVVMPDRVSYNSVCGLLYVQIDKLQGPDSETHLGKRKKITSAWTIVRLYYSSNI